jgi:hypothetical protein
MATSARTAAHWWRFSLRQSRESQAQLQMDADEHGHGTP